MLRVASHAGRSSAATAFHFASESNDEREDLAKVGVSWHDTIEGEIPVYVVYAYRTLSKGIPHCETLPPLEEKIMWRPSLLKNLLLVVLAALAFPLSSVAQVGTCTTASCWSYSSPTGPSNWGGLTPYAYCTQSNAPTQQQSPINVASPTVDTNLKLTINYAGVQVPVEDTGYTIEADYSPGSSRNTVTYGGKTYTLLQFHFHEKSEHTINGTGAPMEVHLVHKASDGTYLVIGVLINVPATGGTNEGYQKVREAIDSHNHPEQTIDPIQMIPGTANSSSLSFYTYAGSLTTPPCTPGVTWIVLKDPIQISQTQLNWYKYTNSSRGVQPTISGLSLQSNFQP